MGSGHEGNDLKAFRERKQSVDPSVCAIFAPVFHLNINVETVFVYCHCPCLQVAVVGRLREGARVLDEIKNKY